ncbi:MAG: N-formylglutamate amidohydrolase [Sphingomonas sp.]|nr:N-formylglutamate amidohydrolase [Sphingomonas sp.]
MHEPLPGPIVHAPRGALPVLLSVPHAGRDYPDWLVAMARGGVASLRPLEDPLVDRLVWRALRHGVGAVIARAPRAAVDCNRAEDEIDPVTVHGGPPPARRPSARARGGLGIVPSRTALHGHLWRRPISHPDLELRLTDAYRPYHDSIAARLGALVDRFGCALLLDCHSMPPAAGGGSAVIFGDRYGRSAAPWLAAGAARIAAEAGFAAAINDPFAGGHVVERHGAPHLSVHAVQIEIDRSCYLTPGGEPSVEFNRLATLIETLAMRLGHDLLDHQLAAAAE